MDRYTFLQLLLCIGTVWGHGRMIEPPMRSSMWRYGFKTPKNYNDNELNCGGFARMMDSGGRCGPCGDPWTSPRNNEAGGRYGTGTIARHYAAGQIINVTVELTSNHQGYYEFRLCPNNNPSKAVTQACLNRNVLNIMGYGKRYTIKTKDSNLFMEFQLSLPPGLTCSQCVLQWKWRAAQNKGSNGKGGECFGCGPQEHFINCADVSIGSRSNPLPLNRPGYKGVYVSKTGPKTKIFHNTPTPTAAKSNSVSTTYDPSVMEPPVGSYSDIYTPVDTNNYQNNEIYVNNNPAPAPRQQYQTYQQPTRSRGATVKQAPTMSKQVSYDYVDTNNYQNDMYVNNNPAPAPRQQYQTYQQPTGSRGAAVKQAPTMSKQVSYDNVLDSKNQITSMVLQYMSSLPMETAMESALIECSEGYTRPICKAVPMWNNNRPFDEWCSMLCPTGVCPAAICSCTCPMPSYGLQQNNNNHIRTQTIKCRSKTAWSEKSMDQWCTSTCNANPDNCPSDHCNCDGL